jgi:hypothetical protein
MAGRCPLHSDPSVTVSIIRAKKNKESIHNCLRVFACKLTSKPHKLLIPPKLKPCIRERHKEHPRVGKASPTLVIMRPVGVVSKKDIGARKMLCNILR